MTTSKPSAFPFSASTNPFLPTLAAPRPFADAPVAAEVAADAPEGSYTYQLVQSGPAVPADECETTAAAVEIMIRWGSTVLHVAHLTPVRSFWLGEDVAKGSKGDKADFFLPEEKLGARRAPLVLAIGGSAHLVLPAGAFGSITMPGAAPKSVAQVLASGAAEPCDELAGAHRIALPSGAKASIEVNGIAFDVSAVHAGKHAGRFALKGETLPYQGLSLLLHVSLLAATALFVPSLAMANEEGINDNQVYELKQMLSADALRELDETKENTVDTTKAGEHGDSGEASKGEQGKAGSTTSTATNRRFAVSGEGPEHFLSKTEALQQARDFGMIGILASMNGSVNTPTSPFGREIANGPDALDAKGGMFGDTIGDAAGSGGLGLTGVGESGGGDGEGIGVGRLQTIGHDFVQGNGHSIGLLRATHIAKSPGTLRMSSPTVSGRLPPEIIQRVVRQNFGRFKGCYESGLRGNPNLGGRVAVRFVIGRDGAVSNVANGGSDLPDAGVVSCVTRAFYGLSFPQPENGIVTVTYPIVFAPGN
jgi:hypothetical protein